MYLKSVCASFGQSYSQSQARLMFVTTLGMDNFDCTKMNAHNFQKIHSLSTGGAHSRVETSTTSPTSPPYVAKQLTALFHTQPLFSFLVHFSVVPTIYSRILVKAQPGTRSSGPRSPTRLGIRSQDLGLPNEYSLGHCGLFAASRHKLAFTSRHYALLTATDTTALH